ncbi:hypothetical protein N7492_005814 [Penicillium capsulatum]|uniref:Alpha/beta hydrolase fold-3 domain-containing protein n=1 Tax=Penicillium capsulatum TaxID=69766 RepID=A0A9W9ID57_9EURO|nr:hypothetical protein N7492_005814 [Penicillium capsulatum]KAJ6135086.1 hypothetical protein N7512_000246 [Penicillium capsulatum]
MDTTSPSPPRAVLAKKAHYYRLLQRLLSWLDRNLSWPLPPRPCLKISIPSTIGNHPGEISLYFFSGPSKPISPERTIHHYVRRPVLLNFHGGGFTIGSALDDARWAGTVLKAFPDAVVVSVNYRLAPEHPFPVGVEDGVDAILWLWAHAEEYNLDITRFALCGDSSGGNFALTVPLRLHAELAAQDRLGRDNDIRLAGLIAFYPSTDWTRTRKERDATNPIAVDKSMIPPAVFALFDDSYLQADTLPKKPGTAEVDMAHAYLSPGLAPTSLLLAEYPPHIAIYTCGWDQLLVEGNTFRERLRQLAVEGHLAHVEGFTVENVVHGFDKKPTFCMAHRKRDQMYGDAVRQLQQIWRTS